MTLPHAVLLLHQSAVPHVHPHEAGIALTITFALAVVAGVCAAILKRKPAGF